MVDAKLYRVRQIYNFPANKRNDTVINVSPGFIKLSAKKVIHLSTSFLVFVSV